MEKILAWLGLAACALVVGATVLLGAVRIAEGSRTLVHVSHSCKPPKATTDTCVTDHYEGSWVARPWLIVGAALSVCAGAIGLSLIETLRAHKNQPSDVPA
ncbi:MAG: hypothetical protein JWO22_2405 [Frankiales bacterium]|nr:hypothetical protein [Frankiales bacterium]